MIVPEQSPTTISFEEDQTALCVLSVAKHSLKCHKSFLATAGTLLVRMLDESSSLSVVIGAVPLLAYKTKWGSSVLGC